MGKHQAKAKELKHINSILIEERMEKIMEKYKKGGTRKFD